MEQESGWKYLKAELLPQLVLAVEIFPESHPPPIPKSVKPPFSSNRVWHPICHQTAGNACQSRYLWATLLTPHPDALRGMITLNNRYESSLLGWDITGSPTLDDLNQYQQDIQTLIHPNCSCNATYRDLAEAFYPFDLSCLSVLTAESIPDDLDSLLTPKPESASWLESLNWHQAWKLILLGKNCD